MKLRALAAIATLVACGSAPAASPSITNPKPNILTDQTQTTSAQANEANKSNASTTTTTAGHRGGDYSNAARAHESGEATTPPGKVNTSPGAYPRTPQPQPINTGDPCGWCKDGR